MTACTRATGGTGIGTESLTSLTPALSQGERGLYSGFNPWAPAPSP